MNDNGPHYRDGTALKIGDRVHLSGWTDDFEVRGYRHEGVAIIANVTPDFEALGTSTLSIGRLTFVRRADGAV